MENKEKLGDEILKIASNYIKKVESVVCGEFEKKFVMKSGGYRLKSLVEDLTNEWQVKEYRVQKFQFTEDEETGVLVQIGRDVGTVETIVTAAIGQQMAVCVKMLPQGEDLSIWIGCGKWLDKVFSGVVSWALLPPLLVLPLAGVWRQKSMMENVMHDVLVWFANHPPSEPENQEIDEDSAEVVSLFCEKMSKADWVREAAADRHADNVSGSLNFKLGEDLFLQLAFCPVGRSDGYWNSKEVITEAQWKAVMPDKQWNQSLEDEQINEFCIRLSQKYQAYMPKGYTFQWKRIIKEGDNGFLVLLAR